MLQFNFILADFGKCVDRHENIGKGTIGMNAFSFLMNDPRFDDIPMVLETPEGDYVREMLDLYNLVGNEATESDEAEDTPSQGTKQKSKLFRKIVYSQIYKAW